MDTLLKSTILTGKDKYNLPNSHCDTLQFTFLFWYYVRTNANRSQDIVMINCSEQASLLRFQIGKSYLKFLVHKIQLRAYSLASRYHHLRHSGGRHKVFAQNDIL